MAWFNLRNFFDFIVDENGELLIQLFEANVRDYQGEVEVNKAIQTSLDNDSGEDFWWLNNGVSIVATGATQSYKDLTNSRSANSEWSTNLQTNIRVF